MMNPETQKVIAKIRYRDQAELGKGYVWSFKYFVLFPILSRLNGLDHLCRVIFPAGYVFTIAWFLGQI